MFLVSKVNVDPSRITYFIDGFNIYILENSKNNGMGFVETIRDEIKRKGELALVQEFIKWSIEFLTKHEEYINQYQKTLKEDSKASLYKLKDSKIFEKVVKLQNKIKELNDRINSYIGLEQIDLITYRHILCQELRGWEEYEDELSEYILPIVHAEGLPKLCVDGCDECLIFYRGCSDPFSQNYTISKTLVLKFLKFISKGHLSLIGKNLGGFLQNFMDRAEKIIIKVPYIDDYGFRLLLEQKTKNKNNIVICKSLFFDFLNLKILKIKNSNFHAIASKFGIFWILDFLFFILISIFLTLIIFDLNQK